MKKAKILTVLGVLLAMGITACNGNTKKSSSSVTPASSSQPAPSSTSQAPSSSSQAPSSTSQAPSSSSQNPSSSSSATEHTHSWGDWAKKTDATCTDPGTEERECSECHEKEVRDTKKLDHDLDDETAVVRLNSDNKKVTQKDCKVGHEHVLTMPLDNNSGIFKTVDGAEKDQFTIGDASTFKPTNGVYKMTKKDAILFKINVATAVQGAEIEIGAKYTNPSSRYFYNHGDGGSQGDNPDSDTYRYYTKVNDGEFVGIKYSGLMSSIFGDGTTIEYMPLGKFDLKAGENLIYVRQGNLGYRVSLEGEFRVAIGSAQIGGTVPTHQHVAGEEWKSDANKHWHECVGANCDEEGVKLEEAEHTWGTPEVVTAATCTEKGEQKVKCVICQYEKTEEIAALGHNFEGQTPVVHSEPTCDQEGSKTTHCVRCDKDIDEVIPALGHTYGEPAVVAAKGEGYVGYNKLECSVDHAIRLEIKALDGTLAEGSSVKSGTPEGYLKLNSNGNSISWKFDLELPADVDGAIGMIYQRGVMDGFSSNKGKTYAWYDSRSNNTRPEGNFDLTVNGSLVDFSAFLNVTFEDLTKGGVDSGLGDSYSPLADCPVGQISLNKGDNTVVYKRTGSYNLAISEIVLVVKTFKHVHAAGEEWLSNETKHWHVCNVAGCPVEGGYKMDEADHTWGEKYDEVPATCSAKGSYKQKCTVCQYEKTVETDKIDHTWGEWDIKSAATCEAAGSKERECTVCHEKETARVAKLDHVYGDVVNSYAAGEGYVAAKSYNCSLCNKSALRWSALDFDATLSDSGLEKNADNVRFKSGSVENKGNTEVTGSHIVYKVNVKEAVASASLAFKVKNSGGNNGKAPVFGPIPNDSSVGYIKQADGSLVESTHRYGLKVNGVEYFLGEDDYGDQSSKTGWFDWPVSFPLEAGVNTIDVFAYRGYRANMYEFQLTGLPLEVNTHEHANDGTWKTDENNHWHVCTNDGCPEEGGIYDKAAHTWGEPVVVPATQDTEGSETYTCSVCGATKVVKLDKLPVKEWSDTECIAGCAKSNPTTKEYASGVKGVKSSQLADSKPMTLTYTAAAAGTLKLRMYLSIKVSNNDTFKNNNGGGSGFWYHDNNKETPKEKMRITVNGVQVTPPGALEDIDFKAQGCTVGDTKASDSGALSVPIWIDICDVTLQEGENTIQFEIITNSYSFFICGVALSKQRINIIYRLESVFPTLFFIG